MKKKNRILWGGALIMIGIIAAAGIFFSRNDSQENPKDTGWQIYWNDVKDDWTQISLLPGSEGYEESKALSGCPGTGRRSERFQRRNVPL